MTVVYIGVGGNLGDREGNIRRAVTLLDGRSGVRVLRESSLYETAPVDVDDPDAPDFLNGALEIETDLDPEDLLAVLKGIERELGREPSSREAEGSEGERRYRSRPIDLDILLYGDEVIGEPGLEVPHPRMTERRFVLEPLAELCPEHEVPGTGRTVSALLEGVA